MILVPTTLFAVSFVAISPDAPSSFGVRADLTSITIFVFLALAEISLVASLNGCRNPTRLILEKIKHGHLQDLVELFRTIIFQ